MGILRKAGAFRFCFPRNRVPQEKAGPVLLFRNASRHARAVRWVRWVPGGDSPVLREAGACSKVAPRGRLWHSVERCDEECILRYQARRSPVAERPERGRFDPASRASPLIPGTPYHRVHRVRLLPRCSSSMLECWRVAQQCSTGDRALMAGLPMQGTRASSSNIRKNKRQKKWSDALAWTSV